MDDTRKLHARRAAHREAMESLAYAAAACADNRYSDATAHALIAALRLSQLAEPADLERVVQAIAARRSDSPTAAPPGKG